MALVVSVLRRLPGWWLATALGVGGVAIIAPHQLGVLLFKLSQVTCAVGMAYLADRAAFRDAPAIAALDVSPIVYGCRLLARAVIFLGVLVALAVGL